MLSLASNVAAKTAECRSHERSKSSVGFATSYPLRPRPAGQKRSPRTCLADKNSSRAAERRQISSTHGLRALSFGVGGVRVSLVLPFFLSPV